MCQACKYPREFKTGDIAQCSGYKVEIIKQYQEARNNELDRIWYQTRILENGNIMDTPCNALCYVSPEGDKRIYAKPGKCMECGKLVRVSYPESIGMHGHWTCPECGYEYPFMFFDIKHDPDYKPSETTGIDRMQFKAE